MIKEKRRDTPARKSEAALKNVGSGETKPKERRAMQRAALSHSTKFDTKCECKPPLTRPPSRQKPGQNFSLARGLRVLLAAIIKKNNSHSFLPSVSFNESHSSPFSRLCKKCVAVLMVARARSIFGELCYLFDIVCPSIERGLKNLDIR
ncbi:hypothetical protein CEXT_548001 [Caerostris extrusa]|uniref:Uncharacterized protein n=1 Tax=Caerostris extrusa TaxID=172846 RepID=A0AAV4P1A7_CAEEX|nr:hypothetical protein CEXT_548001 [Caerostris extrusa]